MVSDKYRKLEEINRKKFWRLMPMRGTTEEQLTQEIEIIDEYKIRYHQAKALLDVTFSHSQLSDAQNVEQAIQASRDNVRA